MNFVLGTHDNLEICSKIGLFIGGNVSPVLNYVGIDEGLNEDKEYMYSEAEFKSLRTEICDEAFRVMLEIQRCALFNADEFRSFSRANYGFEHMRLKKRMGINQTSLMLLKALYRDARNLSESYILEDRNMEIAVKSLTLLRMRAGLRTPVVLPISSDIRPSALGTGLTEVILRAAVKCEKEYWYAEDADILVIAWHRLLEMIKEKRVDIRNCYLGLISPMGSSC